VRDPSAGAENYEDIACVQEDIACVQAVVSRGGSVEGGFLAAGGKDYGPGSLPNAEVPDSLTGDKETLRNA